jgi:uncharacterized protein involved in type VI secretion and phage assembly
MSTQFFGKYRGVVTDNQDPMMIGRIRASVPDVLGDQASGWAMPCTPYAGNGVGLFLIPPVNTSVWMEFEHGDPDYPIWSGCFWGQGEPPATPAVAAKKMLKTDSATITLDDTPGAGGITLETTGGQKIEILATGITIDNGQGAKITLQGPKVDVNSGALEIT